MINQTQTLDLCGYSFDNIPDTSHKPICLNCDYCGSMFKKAKREYIKNNLVIQKDACKTCRGLKTKEVLLSKYGIDNMSKRPDIKDKIRASNINRLQSKEYQLVIKNTMVSKYGQSNSMLVPSLVKKQQESLLDKYGVDNPMRIPGVAKAASKKAIETKINRGLIETFDKQTCPEKDT